MNPERVFIDTGAWIALAVTQDPLHVRAREIWESLRKSGAQLFSSVPVVLETFTYLDRRGSRELAVRWKDSLSSLRKLELLELSPKDLNAAWLYFERKEFHKLSLVDASSFVLMKKHQLRVVFSFDAHFSIAGFRFAS